MHSGSDGELARSVHEFQRALDEFRARRFGRMTAQELAIEAERRGCALLLVRDRDLPNETRLYFVPLSGARL